MARFYFVGIKHSGKTTQARLAAAMLGMEYIDADDLVLQGLSGETIREAYRREGKEAFARRELEAVSRFIEDHDSFILSLGGGASDNKALMDTLKESGKIIYLTRCEKEMLPVILRHGIPPFLDEDDLEGSFHALYQRRDAIYRSYADLIIDLGPYGDKEETAKRTAQAIREEYDV